MSKYNQQCNRNSKYSIKRFLFIEDEQDENSKGNTGKNRTQRYKTGEIKDYEEYSYTTNCHYWLNGYHHPKQGSHPLSSFKVCEHRENVTHHSSQAKTYHEISPVPFVVHIVRDEYIY